MPRQCQWDGSACERSQGTGVVVSVAREERRCAEAAVTGMCHAAASGAKRRRGTTAATVKSLEKSADSSACAALHFTSRHKWPVTVKASSCFAVSPDIWLCMAGRLIATSLCLDLWEPGAGIAGARLEPGGSGPAASPSPHSLVDDACCRCASSGPYRTGRSVCVPKNNASSAKPVDE